MKRIKIVFLDDDVVIVEGYLSVNRYEGFTVIFKDSNLRESKLICKNRNIKYIEKL